MELRRLERLTSLVATLACLSVLAGLYDTRLQPFSSAQVVTAPPPPAQSERDGRLAVTLTDESKQPIASATVRVYWENRGQYFLTGTAASERNGTAELRNVARGVLWVLAEAPGFARSSSTLVLDGQPRTLALTLAHARTLGISVREDDGKPLPRATVLVKSADPLPFGALTGADGHAQFTRLGKAPYTVKVAAPGYESVTRSGITGDETITLRRLGSLLVRVELPDGSRAAGASVSLASAVLWPARRADTNAQGEAHITGLLAGAYDLRAARGELVSDTRYGIELVRGGSEQVTLRLHPGRMVSALVTEGDGEPVTPIGGAEVVLVEQGLGSFPLHGRTGKNGLVRLGPIAEGPAAINARAPEFVARSAVPVPEQGSEPVRIGLLKGATLRGTVEDVAGHGIDGASIEVIGTDLYGLPIADNPELARFGATHFEWAMAGPRPLIPAGELGVMPGPVPPIPKPGAAPVTTGALATNEPNAATNELAEPWVTRLDGSFSAHPVTPGRVRAIVRHPAYVEGTSEAVTLAPGGEASVKVVLYAGGSLEGRLVDEIGRPVGGARIDLSADRGTLERTTVTAGDGSFAFAAVPKEVSLSVTRPDDFGVALRESVRVAEGEKKRIELVLPSPRKALTVVVRDARGAPIETAQVTALSLDPGVPLRKTLFTPADGLVNIADASGLALRLLVEAPGFARAERSFDKAPEKAEIALERGIVALGKVTAVRGRVAVAGASISLLADGVRKSAITDSDGVYRIRDVAPGKVHVVATHPDYARAELDAQVAQTTREDRPFELPAIDLEEGAEILGTVVDGSGRPVAGARVGAGVVPAYLPPGELPAGVTVTDTSGAFRLRGVQAGRVDVEAYAADVGRGETAVTAQSGRPTTGVRIQLAPSDASQEPLTSGGVAVTLGERGDPPNSEVVIVHVASGSEAERSGIEPGDVIASLDGAAVVGMNDARARLSGPLSSDVIVAVRREQGLLKLRVRREAVRR